MDNSLWLLMLGCALGTYLLRLLPLLWMQRHLLQKNSNSDTNNQAMPSWLTVLAPTMIAAMFGVSLVPAHSDLSTWLATFLGGLCTLLVWRRTRSLGWPVCAGVAAYGLVVLLFTI